MTRLQARITWAVVTASAAGALALAGWLRPDQRGYGTHTQLTHGPCVFRWITGIPCPTCGMTTSFAHMARLQVRQALRVQPFAAVLFVAVAAVVPVGLVAVARGRGPRLRVPPAWVLGVALALLIGGWLWQVFGVRSLL